MSRNPINWTEDRKRMAKKAISQSRMVFFRNESAIAFDKKEGVFYGNIRKIGFIQSKVRVDLLPDDMNFEEVTGLGFESDESDEFLEEVLEPIGYSGSFNNYLYGGEYGLDDDEVLYCCNDYSDCSFDENGIKALSKILDLFMKMNLYPYVEGDDDLYELGAGCVSGNDSAVNMERVRTTLDMVKPMFDTYIKPVLSGMKLSCDEKTELVKLLVKD